MTSTTPEGRVSASELERLAAKLSKAQQRWLTDAFYGRGGWRIVGHRKKACELGLCQPGTSLIAPLGLALRAHLLDRTTQGVSEGDA